jgi:transposase
MTDQGWELIADLVAPYWTPGSMGRPVKVDRRRVVDAIFYVEVTGCQWRALPDCYPNWNTLHRYHLAWSKDGTWERVAERLAVRQKEGRQGEPSAGTAPLASPSSGANLTAPISDRAIANPAPIPAELPVMSTLDSVRGVSTGDVAEGDISTHPDLVQPDVALRER